jgi:ABC-2 type transport system ATP-binding protein
MSTAISIRSLSHRYGERKALDDVSLEIAGGEIFGILGPNGGGKTTLFRLLSTLIPMQQGEACVLGRDLRRETYEIRRRIGVVFQAASLDKKLTVAENLRYQAALYGLSGQELRRREAEVLEQFGLVDRAGELCERLSGGLRRRVELAKGMIHHPQLLLLDEPSTGLDPGARLELWRYLAELRDRRGATIILTTHILEEAAKADRLAIMHQGRLVALDTPAALQATIGGDAITIKSRDPVTLAAAIRDRFRQEPALVDGGLRLEVREGHEWISRLVEGFPGQIDEITLGKPTLEDVFIAKTGHRFDVADRDREVAA